MISKMLLMKMTNAITPECKTIADAISRSMDEKISWRERLAIRIHNLGCVLCERYRQQLLMIRKFLETAKKVENDESVRLSAGAKKRIKEQVQSHI